MLPAITNPNPIIGMKYMIPFFLLYLNRDDDTFGFVRFWMNADAVEPENFEELLRRSQEGDWVFSHEKITRFVDIFEEIPDFK